MRGKSFPAFNFGFFDYITRLTNHSERSLWMIQTWRRLPPMGTVRAWVGQNAVNTQWLLVCLYPNWTWMRLSRAACEAGHTHRQTRNILCANKRCGITGSMPGSIRGQSKWRLHLSQQQNTWIKKAQKLSVWDCSPRESRNYFPHEAQLLSPLRDMGPERKGLISTGQWLSIKKGGVRSQQITTSRDIKSSVAGRWSSVLYLWVKGEPRATKHNTGGVLVVYSMHKTETATSKF